MTIITIESREIRRAGSDDFAGGFTNLRESGKLLFPIFRMAPGLFRACGVEGKSRGVCGAEGLTQESSGHCHGEEFALERGRRAGTEWASRRSTWCQRVSESQPILFNERAWVDFFCSTTAFVDANSAAGGDLRNSGGGGAGCTELYGQPGLIP